MTIKEAINLLDNLLGMVDDNQNSDYDTALHMGIDALKAEPHWIPCSERLPDNRRYVLVTYQHEYGLIDHGITWYGEAEKKWDTSREVIAWTPLPEPFNPDDFSQYMNPPED